MLDQPQHTPVFILHPVQAGTRYWTRPLDLAKQPSLGQRQSRLEQYRRLTAVLLVIGLFISEAASVYYARVLAAAGLRWSTVNDLAANWAELTVPAPRH